MIYYSKSTGGFYDDAISGLREITTTAEDGTVTTEANPACTIPADAVEITDTQHQALLAGQSSGQVITADANGNPINQVVTLTAAQQWAAYQAQAKTALADTSTTVERIVEAVALGKTTLTTADVVTYMEYRAALRAILGQAQPDVIPVALPARPPYPANT